MASSTLVKDVLFRVSTQLHDISPQFTRWTQLELVTWLNDGQKAIAKYLPSSCTRVDSILLKPGSKQSIDKVLANSIVPGDGSAAVAVSGNVLQSVIRNMGADGATPGRAIRPIDREVLDSNSPNWHTTTGTYVSSYVFDPRFPKIFYVSPAIPATPAQWVELSWLVDPVMVSTTGSYAATGNDTTLISVDDRYVDELTNYILAHAYMKAGETEEQQLAQAHLQLFTESLSALANVLITLNPNLRSTPATPNLPKKEA